jgi:hypothetical protein
VVESVGATQPGVTPDVAVTCAPFGGTTGSINQGTPSLGDDPDDVPPRD